MKPAIVPEKDEGAPIIYTKNYGRRNQAPLLAFVGQKVWVEPLPHRKYSMDNGFKACYVVKQVVYGAFNADTIEFTAYDHYGVPAFSEFEHVLLYVSAHDGFYFHQKYMYNEVYKTAAGRWAGPYASSDYTHEYNENTKIKPSKIKFLERVRYPVRRINSDGTVLRIPYPAPYFETEGDSAIPIYGNYVEDLFVLKRDGYLTARELFKDGRILIK